MPPKKPAAKPATPLGRKRDATRDVPIIEATLDLLAATGFDRMTMDMVAARAKAGKATVYRRWASKPELVRDALIWMSRGSIDPAYIPDTGTLRGDLLAVRKPYTAEFGERKLRVMEGLGSFYAEHRQLAEETLQGVRDSWSKINRALMQRAQQRGEISAQADIELACEVIISMSALRSFAPRKPPDREAYIALLDHIILPSLGNLTGR